MKELVEYIAKSIASHPDEVKVTQEDEDGRVILRLEVADEDKGKIIGKQGKVIKAIRSVVGIAAAKAGCKALVDLD